MSRVIEMTVGGDSGALAEAGCKGPTGGGTSLAHPVSTNETNHHAQTLSMRMIRRLMMISFLFHPCQQGLAFQLRKVRQMPDEGNDMPDLIVLMRRPESGHPRHADAIADNPKELSIRARLRTFRVKIGGGWVEAMRQFSGANLGGAMTENAIDTIVRHPRRQNGRGIFEWIVLLLGMVRHGTIQYPWTNNALTILPGG